MRIQNKIMLGAVIFVLCAAAAYAQVSISSIPVTTVRNTGRAELAGAVRVDAAGAASADTFTIRYGLPITNDTTTGIAIDPASTWACTIAGVDNLGGTVTISCPAIAAAAYFQLIGVRVSVDGFAGSNVTAQIGALTNPITAGQQSAVVIESVAPGLVVGTGNTTQTALANTANITGTGKLFLKEGFASAWKTLAQEGPGATQATQILVTVPSLPTGVTITMTVGAGTSGTLGTDVPGAGLTFTSAVSSRVITITADDPAAVETLELDFNVSFGAVTLPLAANSYTVNATLTPNDPALTATGGVVKPPPATQVFHAPKFAVSNVTGTILTIIPNTTTLLFPYASTQAGYDTGIAIANTTKDPFGTTGGGAAAQSGTITFYFFPNDGTTITPYTTAAGAPGSGLDANGVLVAGNTYTVLLSQLLAKAGRTTAFAGYIIAVSNSSDNHGLGFISDFAGKFTSYTPALVIPNPAITARSTLTNELLLQ